MIKKINTNSNSVLRKKADKVVPLKPNIITGNIIGEKISFWDNDVINHIQDLKDTAASYPDCVGLSSCQIWDIPSKNPLAIFVLKISVDGGKTFYWQEFINPEISTYGDEIVASERCLSFPNYVGSIKRKKYCNIKFNLLNSIDKIEYNFNNDQMILFSILIQHEYDHLQGKTIKK